MPHAQLDADHFASELWPERMRDSAGQCRQAALLRSPRRTDERAYRLLQDDARGRRRRAAGVRDLDPGKGQMVGTTQGCYLPRSSYVADSKRMSGFRKYDV